MKSRDNSAPPKRNTPKSPFGHPDKKTRRDEPRADYRREGRAMAVKPKPRRELREREKPSETASRQALPERAIEPGTILVDRRAVARLRTGNPWVYRSDIASAEGVAAASVAPVVDDRGRSFGTA